MCVYVSCSVGLPWIHPSFALFDVLLPDSTKESALALATETGEGLVWKSDAMLLEVLKPCIQMNKLKLWAGI